MALVLVAVLALAACSSGNDADLAQDDAASAEAPADLEADDADADADYDVADERSDADLDTDATDGGAGGGDAEVAADGDAVQPVAAVTNRRVIRTADLELEVDDPGDAADEVVAIATRAQGFVAEADLQRDDEGVVRGSMTLRVPTDQLLPTVDELDALARAVPVRRIDERDVTAQSADLEAQLTNLRTYESELRTLLGDVRETTDRPDDLLSIFERIRSVREEIDRIDAQLAVLGDQVSLATIRVELVPSSEAFPVTDPTWQPGTTARDAIAATARTLTGLADTAIWFVLTAVPVLVVTGLPVALVVLAWWRWRRARPQQVDGFGGPGGPGSGGPGTGGSDPGGSGPGAAGAHGSGPSSPPPAAASSPAG